MNREEALELIKGSSKFSHSLLVSKIMRVLAEILMKDEEEWEFVGLLHDLDYDIVNGEMHRHGILAAEMLEGKLSDKALHAIRAHDHRTGVKPQTILDESLIFADSLAVLMEDQGLTQSVDSSSWHRALRREADSKPWISEKLLTYCERREISVSQILQIL
jgi:predicted hydrolase (HD superfamily)